MALWIVGKYPNVIVIILYRFPLKKSLPIVFFAGDGREKEIAGTVPGGSSST